MKKYTNKLTNKRLTIRYDSV